MLQNLVAVIKKIQKILLLFVDCVLVSRPEERSSKMAVATIPGQRSATPDSPAYVLGV